MQDRSALFFKRENACIASILPQCCGQLALIYGTGFTLDLAAFKMPFVFKACAESEAQTDLVYAEDQWPLPLNFFDLIVLHHPLEQKRKMDLLIQAAKQALRPDGVLIVTGFNRRILTVLSSLEQQDFCCKVHRFNLCRMESLSHWVGKMLPFLSKGFVIEARIDTVSLTPLQEKNLSQLMARLLPVSQATANPVMRRDEHES